MRESPNTLSYHLALYLILFGKASGATCYERLNLANLVCVTVQALNRKEKVAAALAVIQSSLDELRTTYEPSLDHSEWASEKRSAFDTLLYLYVGQIEAIIDEYNMIQRSTIQEVLASSWNNKGVEK